ncbi:MAG: biotin/lipoyl-containing protein [Candidatus Competibacteraceae bacterium]|nr:biotin/lipoyl-containing protein [Candidatus Competibacteraceae bacterium]
MQRKFKINVDGRPYTVTVEEITEGSSLIFPEPGSMNIPEPTAATPNPDAASTPAMPAAGPGDEVSPLAGVVQTVLVKVGQDVNEGDKLVAVEAMKMVTHVFSHRAGKVTAIAVKDGDAVDVGQVLLTIG